MILLTGKTHVNLGFLAATTAKVSIPVVPSLGFLLLFNLLPVTMRFALLATAFTAAITLPTKAGMLLFPLAIIIGSLMPDIDHPNSMLSRLVAPTGLVMNIMLVSIGGIIVWHGVQGKSYLMPVGVVICLMGINIIPANIRETLQRLLLIIAGSLLVYWSYSLLFTSIGMFYMAMGLLSHRGLTHSLEGVAIITVVAWSITSRLGYPELLLPFVVGYAVHLLADLVSDHGIYLSYFAKVKLAVPLFKTNTILERGIGLVALGVVGLMMIVK